MSGARRRSKAKAPRDALATWMAVADAWRSVFFATPAERKKALRKADRLWEAAIEAFPDSIPESHRKYLEFKRGGFGRVDP